MKVEQVQRWVGEEVEFLDHTKPYTNEVTTLDSENFPLYATLEHLFDNGDCRISFKGKNGELEQVYINCKHIAPKHHYPKAVRAELEGLRRDFELIMSRSGDNDFCLLRWEECSNGVGDYQVDWGNPFFETTTSDQDEAILKKKEIINEFFQFYIDGAVRDTSVPNLKKEMEEKILSVSQINDEILEFAYREHVALNATKWEGVTWGCDLADKDIADSTKKSQD